MNYFVIIRYMKKLFHIFIIIFSIFSLNLQATNMLFDNNTKCEHTEKTDIKKHNHSDKKNKECCDNQCYDCFECQLCTNYLKFFTNTNLTEDESKNNPFYQYFYNIKESHLKKSIIPPIV